MKIFDPETLGFDEPKLTSELRHFVASFLDLKTRVVTMACLSTKDREKFKK